MRRIPALALLGSLALGGCAGALQTMTNEYPQTVNTARGSLQNAAAAGPVLLEVRDNPFSADVARTLAEAASATSIGMKVRFTLDRAQAANPGVRLVVQFSPAPGTSSAAVCDASRPVSKVDVAGRMTALVAFCDRAQPILSMAASGARPESGDAPVIRNLAEQAMLRMFVSSGDSRESPSDFWPDL
ncbi:MAG: hypothetical protein FJX54_07190 [Alphaproteobacteria bacterium]|nr:hypothetical protein [Alphaproteobacteria bacterium]